MIRTIKIGDQNVEMLANAASPYLYSQIFHADFLKESMKAESDMDIHIWERMGFVFAMRAKMTREEMQKLTMDDFLNWLEEFAPMAVLQASQQISALYQEQSKVGSHPKK